MTVHTEIGIPLKHVISLGECLQGYLETRESLSLSNNVWLDLMRGGGLANPWGITQFHTAI